MDFPGSGEVMVELHSRGPVENLDDGQDRTILSARQPLHGELIARRLARSEVVPCALPDGPDARGHPCCRPSVRCTAASPLSQAPGLTMPALSPSAWCRIALCSTPTTSTPPLPARCTALASPACRPSC